MPERAILPFVIALPVFGLAAIISKLQHYFVPTELNLQRSLFLGVSSSFLYFAPAELREIIVWGLAFLFFIKIYLEKKISSQSLLPLFFLSLGLPSLTGFKERLLPPAVSFQTIDQLDTMRKQLLQAYPALYLPFIRNEVDLAWIGGGVNTAYWMGLSSLDGYWPPTRRFLELLEALEGKKLPKTTMYFKMSQYPTAYPYLSRLYNLKYQIHLTGNQLQVRPLDTHGESAWFGAEMIRASSYEEIAQWIKANEKDLNRKIALMSSDAFDTKKNIEECVHSKVVSIQGTYRTQRAVVETQSSADCPLVVAANFSEVLIVRNESKQILKTFPAYGALLGIWVPAGTKKIFIDAN